MIAGKIFELQPDFEIREEAIRRQEYYAYVDRIKAEKDAVIAAKDSELAAKDDEIAKLKAELDKLINSPKIRP